MHRLGHELGRTAITIAAFHDPDFRHRMKIARGDRLKTPARVRTLPELLAAPCRFFFLVPQGITLATTIRAVPHPMLDVGVRIAAWIFVAAACAGCAEVAPYQRGRLAHPTMAPGNADSLARAHVYSVQEGAVGGTPGASSGCGCN